jgi:hypothetical protein
MKATIRSRRANVRTIGAALAAGIALFGAAMADAQAGGGVGVGVYVGPGYYRPYGYPYYRPYPYFYPPFPAYSYPVYPYPYPYPYYAPPVVATVPASPPVYVERSDIQPGAQQGAQGSGALQPGYWYYCRNPEGYYPSVQQCPGGWQQVAPRQPNAQ